MDRFGWCFIGSGNITRRVMADMGKTRGGYLAAVYSRRLENAEKLAAEHGAKAYDDLQQALRDPNVRAVYVATPHTLHDRYAMEALRAGKPVLCEKPFTLNSAQAREVFSLAQEAGLYIMEGMWTRFNPAVERALDWVRQGKIGRVLSLSASFAGRWEDESSRVFLPDLGGGALLDVGVYTVAFSQFVFGGLPEDIQAMARLNPGGVDVQCALQLRYPGGATSRLFSAVEVETEHDACIYGETGRIRVPKFWSPDSAELIINGETETFQFQKAGEGFQFEFDAVMDDIRAGRLENDKINHRFTLDVLGIMDEARHQVGVVYPQELG